MVRIICYETDFENRFFITHKIKGYVKTLLPDIICSFMLEWAGSKTLAV